MPNEAETERRLIVGGEVWLDEEGPVESLVEVGRTDADEVKVEIRPMADIKSPSLYLSKAAAYELSKQLDYVRREGWPS